MDEKTPKQTFVPGSTIGTTVGSIKNGAIIGSSLGAVSKGVALGGVFGPIGSIIGGLLGGLSSWYLSQITSVAEDLTNDTVQNWVKRDLVERPKGKTYDQDQVARILIINSLRKVMDLGQIKKILDYINGDLVDKSDDIVQETALLYYYTLAVSMTNESNPKEAEAYTDIVEQALSGFQEIRPGDKEKLSRALTIMCIAHQANELKKEADRLIEYL